MGQPAHPPASHPRCLRIGFADLKQSPEPYPGSIPLWTPALSKCIPEAFKDHTAWVQLVLLVSSQMSKGQSSHNRQSTLSLSQPLNKHLSIALHVQATECWLLRSRWLVNWSLALNWTGWGYTSGLWMNMEEAQAVNAVESAVSDGTFQLNDSSWPDSGRERPEVGGGQSR